MRRPPWVAHSIASPRGLPGLVLLLALGCADGGGPTAVLPPAPTSGYTALAIGIHHGCGVLSGEGTFCWGRNVAGELGDGTIRSSLSPVRVSGGADFTALSLGSSHSCALTSAGAALCFF